MLTCRKPFCVIYDFLTFRAYFLLHCWVKGIFKYEISLNLQWSGLEELNSKTEPWNHEYYARKQIFPHLLCSRRTQTYVLNGLFEHDENMVLLALKPNLGKIQWFWACLWFNSNSDTDLQLRIPFIGMNFPSEFKSEKVLV